MCWRAGVWCATQPNHPTTPPLTLLACNPPGGTLTPVGACVLHCCLPDAPCPCPCVVRWLQSARDDKPGLLASAERIHKLIDGLVADGVPSDRIVLGGFSQGGACTRGAGGLWVGLGCWG